MMKSSLLFSYSLPAFLSIGYLGAQETKPYFQQEVNYKINVTLDDRKHDLIGDATEEYINNSPDELTFIWFHIWPNAYKNNSTPLARQLIDGGNKKFYYATQEERGWIDGLGFKVNGQTVKTEPGESIDIIKLVLNEPLKPGGRVTITTPFHVHIPIGVFSRLGHIYQQYQITQWFPKPAVYDKYGWHAIPYLNQGEFYSEFGSFDVSITIPKNYVVGATGTLVNGEEETAWLMKKDAETRAIEKYVKTDTVTPPSSSEMKTLRYTAQNVHDFGWFADKRYHVLHDTVLLPHSKNKVDTWVLFTNLYGEYWKKSVKYVNDAVYYYSLWNGDYPYPHATAVDGALSAGGGMEYPMITVIGGTGSDESLDQVITHEVGHNWFYGILGSNERDHGWMDEGVNSFNENRYMKTKYPPDSAKRSMQAKIGGMNMNIGKILGVSNLDESTLFDLGYRYSAVKKEDQPIDLTSAEYTTINYGTIVYGKTAVILRYLQAYLGEDVYDQCAQKYYETWKFRHPYPADIRKVYEEVSGKDLSWFFGNMIPTTNQVDYKILSCKKSKCATSFTGDCWEVKVKNKGKINSPFPVSTIKEGKIVNTTWFDGISGTGKVNIYTMDFDHVKIDAENVMPDINRQNNNLKMRGLCKRTEPFNLKFPGIIHNTDKTQLFWAPVMGWNNYNKFMLGAAIYNNLIPEKKFEYMIMPMYSFHNNDLAGGATVYYNMHFDKIFQTVRLGVKAERYSYSNEPLKDLNFNKIAPEITFDIKKKHLNSSVKQSVYIRQVNVTKEIAVGNYLFRPPVYHYDSAFIAINEIMYTLTNSRTINPYNVSLNVQQGDNFVKSFVTANYKVILNKKGKAVDIRGFGGAFFNHNDLADGGYFYSPSSATGSDDYMYDNVFLGRSETNNENILSHQSAESEGNMKVWTPLGRSDTWIGSLNFKAPLPGKIPFKVFADVVMLPSKAALNETVIYDAGIYIPLFKEYVEVYFPLLMSQDIRDVFYLNNGDLVAPPNGDDPDKYRFKRMARMIRFTFNIHKLNPFEMVRNISL